VADQTTSPLAGKRVLITRAIEQTSDLLECLTARGAVPISLPLVSFAPPNDYAPLDAALNQLHTFDWIIFTSVNAVHSITARANEQQLVTLRARDEDARRTSTQDASPKVLTATRPPIKTPKIAAVGPATKLAAENAGFSITYTAKTHLGVALAKELREHLVGKSVFLPRSDQANPDLPAALRKIDAHVTEVVAYRTVPPADTDKSRVDHAIDHEADAILFFSSSAVLNFADLVGRGRLAGLQDKIAVAAVGPVTARALRELSVHRIAIAADTTAAAVVNALEAYFAAAPAKPKSQSSAGAKTR
jgi:uroporphyrinogen-III synthase